jgi:hypothetical protein
MLYLDLPRPKKFGDSRRRQHLYSPEGGAARAMDCFTPQAPLVDLCQFRLTLKTTSG